MNGVQIEIQRSKLRGVKKRFGPKVVLDGLDLCLNAGDSLVVIGGSGTGKSVTIKCVLGILRPDAGSIKVDGQEVTRLHGAKRDAYAAQIRHAVPGRGAVRQPAGLGERRLRPDPGPRHGARKGARNRDGEACQGRARPRGRDLSPAELSGGMQKRVGLARAIAADPEIIFFDEPTTGLDPIMADIINDLIVDTVKDVGRHRCRSPTTWSARARSPNRIAMLYQGKIIWDGPTEDIDNSGNPYVDQFIHGRAEGPIKMEVRR